MTVVPVHCSCLIGTSKSRCSKSRCLLCRNVHYVKVDDRSVSQIICCTLCCFLHSYWQCRRIFLFAYRNSYKYLIDTNRNTTLQLAEGIMVYFWRDFCIRETGTGQQLAQLHDRYDDDDDDDDEIIICNYSYCIDYCHYYSLFLFVVYKNKCSEFFYLYAFCFMRGLRFDSTLWRQILRY